MTLSVARHFQVQDKVSSDIVRKDIGGYQTFSSIRLKDIVRYEIFAVVRLLQLSDFSVVRHLQLSDTCSFQTLAVISFSVAFYIVRIISSLNFEYQ